MNRKYHPEEVTSGFKFFVPLQIRFSDIDGYLHVNNGVYFNLMEHARALYLHQVCQWDFVNIGAVVANINLDFYTPINLFDQLRAYVRCNHLGKSSFLLEQVLMGTKEDGEAVVFSKAMITMVTISLKTMKSSPLPEEYAVKIRQQDGLEA